MSNIKIVLKRSPQDPENGIWIDGVRLKAVTNVAVSGSARSIPTVTLTVIPIQLELDLEGSDVIQDGPALS